MRTHAVRSPPPHTYTYTHARTHDHRITTRQPTDPPTYPHAESRRVRATTGNCWACAVLASYHTPHFRNTTTPTARAAINRQRNCTGARCAHGRTRQQAVCRLPGCEPNMGSISIGCFLCLSTGIHRALGTHISKVRHYAGQVAPPGSRTCAARATPLSAPTTVPAPKRLYTLVI